MSQIGSIFKDTLFLKIIEVQADVPESHLRICTLGVSCQEFSVPYTFHRLDTLTYGKVYRNVEESCTAILLRGSF